VDTSGAQVESAGGRDGAMRDDAVDGMARSIVRGVAEDMVGGGGEHELPKGVVRA
jgi:hypothetical protein